MALRSRYVFVMLPEFAAWLGQTAEQMELGVVLHREQTLPLKPWDGQEESLAGAKRVYVTAHSVNFADIRADALKPGKMGWLQLDIPRCDANSLYASQLAAKGDWFDEATNTVVDSGGAIRLYDKFWAKWKNHFAFPIVVRNKLTGAEARYPSIGYSRGAADWYRNGGHLRQEGVDNLEFNISR